MNTKGEKTGIQSCSIRAKYNNTSEFPHSLCGTAGTYGLIVAQEEKSQGHKYE